LEQLAKFHDILDYSFASISVIINIFVKAFITKFKTNLQVNANALLHRKIYPLLYKHKLKRDIA